MRLSIDRVTDTPVFDVPPGASPHASRRLVAPAPRLSERAVVPLTAALAAGLLAPEPFEAMVLTLLTFACAAFVVPDRRAWAALLPFMRAPLVVLCPLIGILALTVVNAATGLPGLSAGEMVVVAAISAVASVGCYLSGYGFRRQAALRTAVIGSERSATDLARELALVGIPGYAVVGRIAVKEGPTPVGGEVPTLGTLGGLAEVIETSRVDLLVLTSEAPRFKVFEEVSKTCLHLPVRLWELSSFYEDVFGHVPMAEINAAWFQYIMHPKFRTVAPASKRAVDIVVSLLAALLTAPLMALCALAIRLDGGPVLFKQTRIGEAGRSLTLYKLRTMRVADPDAQWASLDDPRITPIGRFLRRTHLDELPQILNILRGEMSLVGPRPEQPEFVRKLEEVLPFYQRRHLLKPGLTGWAQVRCGYAGSDVGSAWKLSHDLYYLKHRSMAFDLAIIGETFRTVFADRRFSIEPKWVPFIHGYEPLPPPPDTLAAHLRELADAASG
jgi:exopolysaccharide biosynthesis polyprenyl glycosylphosphotransferase